MLCQDSGITKYYYDTGTIEIYCITISGEKKSGSLWFDPLDHSDFCSDFSPSSFSMNHVHIISDMRMHVYILHRMFQSFIDKLPEQLLVEGDVPCVACVYYRHLLFHINFPQSFVAGIARAVFGTPTLWKLAKGFWISPIMLILYYVYIAIYIMECNVLHMRTYGAALIGL